MEEGKQTTIYDDYKFVTREDLERLNLANLLGTNLLRAYMHGFFIDHRLYAKVSVWQSLIIQSRESTMLIGSSYKRSCSQILCTAESTCNQLLSFGSLSTLVSLWKGTSEEEVRVMGSLSGNL